MSALRAGRRLLLAIWVGLLVGMPRAALACSVCTAGRDEENRLAFIVTTVFLSVTPLLLIGGIVWFVARRVREAERQSARSAGPAAAPAPARHARPSAAG